MKKWFYEYNDVNEDYERQRGKSLWNYKKIKRRVKGKGFLTQRGRVNIKYFNERYNIG